MKKLPKDKLSRIKAKIQKDFPNNRIDELINEVNYSGEDLAEIIGYSDKSSISGLRHSNIEKKYFPEEEKTKNKGKGDISSKDLICLSRVFGVSVDYILGLSEYRNIGNEEIKK